MSERKAIKASAKKNLTHPYWRGVFIAILVLVTTTGVLNSLLFSLSNHVNGQTGDYGWLFVKYVIRFYKPDFLIPNPDDMADVALCTLYDSLGNGAVSRLTQDVSYPFYIAYSILSATKDPSLNRIWMAIFGCLLFYVFIAFVLHPLNIGSKAYFYKRMKGENDNHNVIIQAGFNRFYINIVLTRMLKSVFTFLWSLTIIGGVVKHYSYFLVDYIIMDNPSLGPIKSIQLSKKMMKGHKWEFFKLEFSFILWRLLSYLTADLLLIFYLEPYEQLSFAQAYIQVKDEFALDDLALFKESFMDIYENNSKSLIMRRNVEYDVPYELVDYVLIFFIVSFVGWLWEVFYNFINTFQFANRGTLWGPVLPIYGTGAVVALFLLKKFRKTPWLSFLLSVIVCLAIEYCTGLILEKTTGMRYWNYDDMPFNIQGRICLFGGVFFGLGCLVAIYFVGPFLYPLLHRMSKKTRWILSAIFICLILTDFIVSKFYPNPDGMEPISLLFL